MYWCLSSNIKKMKSIVQTNKEYCYLCNKNGSLVEHHIFNGTANRKKSEEDGMKVYLHPVCHRWIHEHEISDLNLKAKGQKIWQEYYVKTKREFIGRYGKSYIDKFEEWRKKNDNSNEWNKKIFRKP